MVQEGTWTEQSLPRPVSSLTTLVWIILEQLHLSTSRTWHAVSSAQTAPQLIYTRMSELLIHAGFRVLRRRAEHDIDQSRFAHFARAVE